MLIGFLIEAWLSLSLALSLFLFLALLIRSVSFLWHILHVQFEMMAYDKISDAINTKQDEKEYENKFTMPIKYETTNMYIIYTKRKSTKEQTYLAKHFNIF